MPTPLRPRDVKADPRRDVDAELRYHLDMRAAEFEAHGMSPDEARRAAAASFGDVDAVEEECVDIREERERVRRVATVRWNLAMDTRYALRTLRRSPLFTIAAVLTLALGIGGAAAVFTLVNGVLLRPLPYADPSRLVMVWSAGDFGGWTSTGMPLSAPDFLDIREQTRALSSIAAFRSSPYTLAGDAAGQGATMVAGVRADPALFRTLGVHPLLGRDLTADDALPGAARVAVIGYDLWQRRFGGDPRIVGRTVTLSGESFSVVGVMPSGFAFPRGAELLAGLQFRPRTELWTPLIFSDQDRAARGTENLAAVARIKPGFSTVDARVDLARIRQALAEEFPKLYGKIGFAAISLAEQAARPVRRGLLMLLGAVGFVLLIACANVANLLVARAARREREFATRAALGATRGRVFLQLVVENATLALTGGVLGLAAATLGTRALLGRLPHDLPRADDVVIDLRVVGVTLAAALLAGVVFAAATTAHAGASVAAAATGVRTTSGRGQRAGRRLLVAAEVALSLVLLVGAGLLTRSFVKLQSIQPGFDARGVMTAGLLAPVVGGFNPQRDGDKWAALFTQYAERLAAQPGIAASGGVSGLPLTGAEEGTNVRVDDRSLEDQPAHTNYSIVVGDYFGAMRIPLLAGRALNAQDGLGSPGAAVVSETFVRKYLPGLSPSQALGHRLGIGFPFGLQGPRAIVGVVGDVKTSSLDADAPAMMYLPIGQVPYPGMSLVARARSGAPTAALPRMRQSLAAVAPTLALSDERPLADVVAASISRQRFALAVTGAFAIVALVLSAVGLYAVIATSVSQRTRELGVRLALGAAPRDVRALVLREGLRVTGFGVVVGLAGAFAAARLLRGQLYDVGIADPLVYVGVAVLTAAVALAATWVPARRATEVDPVLAIRAD
ncbi:permease (plasmid) [Gemmatirosa kalamazoonensis]|uniref:Permease n=1 Tax=Gemmatirosa kalamazoonensis TaxID=861299 RepID=W0RU86_9BACT|nr:ABC transporter permease [Gemmatirosa kalamazoonensis]AHG93880.1 permease [Gemmatirosa kalamazoonensis]